MQTTITMFLNRSEYDRGPNTFSPEGRLFQVITFSNKMKMICAFNIMYHVVLVFNAYLSG